MRTSEFSQEARESCDRCHRLNYGKRPSPETISITNGSRSGQSFEWPSISRIKKRKEGRKEAYKLHSFQFWKKFSRWRSVCQAEWYMTGEITKSLIWLRNKGMANIPLRNISLFIPTLHLDIVGAVSLSFDRFRHNSPRMQLDQSEVESCFSPTLPQVFLKDETKKNGWHISWMAGRGDFKLF